MTKSNTILKFIIPFLMFFFFVRNLVLVETDNMDSWMGGGMRMFAKVDKMIYRVAGFTVNYNGKSYFVNLRNIPELEDEDTALRILPSKERKTSVLQVVKRLNWCYDLATDTIKLSRKNDPCNASIDLKDIIEITVYSTFFDNEANTVQLKLLN